MLETKKLNLKWIKNIGKSKAEQLKLKTEEGHKISERKTVYFLDKSALIHYSGRLYGCFLVEKFDKKYLIPTENSFFATDEHTLNEIHTMELEQEQGIYTGYSDFIRSNFTIVSKQDSNNAYVRANTNEIFAHTLASLFFLDNDEISLVLVTLDKKTAKAAKTRGFEIYKEI